jgi:small conductance mechanosensitive channel
MEWMGSEIQSPEEFAMQVTKEVSDMKAYLEKNLPQLVWLGVKVLMVIAIFIVGRVIIRWIRRFVKHSLERTNVDRGVVQFIDSMLKFGLYVLLILNIATNLGVEPSSLAALIASAGVAIGLALQGSLSNFAGGILILILKPFVVGDYIIENSGKNEGTVKEIQIFYTKLSTLDNKTIVVPNGVLSNSSITNVTARPERQLDLKVGIAYDADLKKAKNLLQQLLESDASVIQDEGIKVFVDSLGDSAVVLGLRAWVKTEEYWPTRWRILEEIKMTFDAEGVEIPYQQLTVHVSNPS